MKLNVFVIFAALVYGSSFVLAAPVSGAVDSDLAVREFYETEDLIGRGYEELEARGGGKVLFRSRRIIDRYKLSTL